MKFRRPQILKCQSLHPNKQTDHGYDFVFRGENRPRPTRIKKIGRQMITEIVRASKPIGELAKQYGVSKSTISRIKNNRTWKKIKRD